jgi:hypothetical protein
MAMETGTGTTETATFTQALASLKRRGSNLLVAGAASGATHADACSRLLGDRRADRTRVFVATDSHCATAERDAQTSGDWLVEYAAPTRGATAATSPTADGPTLPGRATEVSVDDLPSLERAVDDAIAAAGRDSLAPAELRLCFDSLAPLVDEHDEQTVVRFLHGLTSEIRSVRGMGHYHLPAALDSRVVRTLRPLFDGVVEIRTQGERAQQRWHLNEADISTDWLDL